MPDVRSALCRRLRERRAEIEQTALTRVYAIADPVEIANPQYTDGLRIAVCAALDYGFEAIEAKEGEEMPVPSSLLAQARLAARNGVDLDTVLRRYFAGYTLFGDFLAQAAEEGRAMSPTALQRLLRSQAVSFDRLVTAVSEEYGREAKNRPAGSKERLAEQVRRLLAGELIDTAGLEYPLDSVHIGLVAGGPSAPDAVRALARALDRSPLLIAASGEMHWAWLGARRAPDHEELQRALTAWPADVALAIGEPGKGLAGWRLTHRQALAGLTVARRGPNPHVRYADVALLASALQDDLLVTSLRELFLEPIERERDGGKALRKTLRAYLTAESNASSAGALLGISRQAVAKRLRSAEERIGRPLGACLPELDMALRLREFGGSED